MKRSRAALFLFLATLALSLNAIGAANVQLSLAADVAPAPQTRYCPWTPRNPAPKPAPLNFEDVLGVSHAGPSTYVERANDGGSSCDDFDCRSSTYHGGGCFEGYATPDRANVERDAAPIEEYDYGYDDTSSAEGCYEDFDCGASHPSNGNVGNLAETLSRVLNLVQDVAAQLNLENEGLSAAAKATGKPTLELPAEVAVDEIGVDEYSEYDDYGYPETARYNVADNDGHADDLPAADGDFVRGVASYDHPADLPQADAAPARPAIDAETGYAYDEVEEGVPAWDDAENYAEEEYAADHALDLPAGEELAPRHPSDLPASDEDDLNACHASDLPIGEDFTSEAQPIQCPAESTFDSASLRPALQTVSSLLEVMGRGLSEMSAAVRELAGPSVPPVSPIPGENDPWFQSIGRRLQERGRMGL